MLNHRGIRGVANTWFSLYLSNRQRVVLEDITSQRLPITCGVNCRTLFIFVIYKRHE